MHCFAASVHGEKERKKKSRKKPLRSGHWSLAPASRLRGGSITPSTRVSKAILYVVLERELQLALPALARCPAPHMPISLERPRGCPESGALTVSHTHLTLRPTSLSLWFPGRWIESNRLEDPSSAAASPSPAPLSWTGRPPTAAAAPCRHRSLPLMPRPAQSGGSSASPARPGLRGRGPPAA